MAHQGRKSVDELLVPHLAGGTPVREAADFCGVSERTVWRRLADSAFKRQVADCRAGMIERAMANLADSSAAAAEALRGLLLSGDDKIKLRAARSILELVMKMKDANEIHERLAKLEQVEVANQPLRISNA